MSKVRVFSASTMAPKAVDFETMLTPIERRSCAIRIPAELRIGS